MEPKDIVDASDEELSEILATFDQEQSVERVRRLREVNQILAAGPGEGFWHTGGEEATWILSEAKDAYIYGYPIASLFASHAACERRLAGIVASLPDGRAPRDWERWGLGRLTQWATEEGWLPHEFVARVEILAARRKSLVHFHRPVAKDTILYRLVTEATASDRTDLDVAAALESDALDALRTTYGLYSALSGFA